MVVYPDDNRRKAFPLPAGSGSARLDIYTIHPWHVKSSWIQARDSATLWQRVSDTVYTLANGHASEEYVVVHGLLTQNGENAGRIPEFTVTVPGIDLRWEDACGAAALEGSEDSVPAALLMTSDLSQHRHLVVSLVKDKPGFDRRVTLTWNPVGCVRVWRQRQGGEEEITSGSQLIVAGPTPLRVEPITVSASTIKFTAYGQPDDYGGARVEDSVLAFTYDLIVSAIRFNHNARSAVEDGINLRKNRTEPHLTSEWTAAQGARAPICYRTNQVISIKADFKTSSRLLSSARIGLASAHLSSSTPHCFQDFSYKNVTFDYRGNAVEIKFPMQGTTPSVISLFDQEELKWKVSWANGFVSEETTITNTGPHKVYVTLGEPCSPWDNSSWSDNNAWTSALDFIFPYVEGKSEAVEVLRAITELLFTSGGVEFNTMYSIAGYYYDSTLLSGFLGNRGFKLTNYLRDVSTQSSPKPKVICTDQALGVATFGRLLGIKNIEIVCAEPFGFINTTHLVGIDDPCNNPFFMNQQFAPYPVCGVDAVNRSYFDRHIFIRYDNRVFDACVGVHKGELQQGDYLATVIDISTERNLQQSIFMSINHDLKPNSSIDVILDNYSLE